MSRNAARGMVCITASAISSARFSAETSVSLIVMIDCRAPGTTAARKKNSTLKVR